MRRIAAMEGKAPSIKWPMLGMLALGLVAGAALGGYAMLQRSQIKRLATYAGRKRDEMARIVKPELQPVAATTSSNHGRKATAEV